ncbi:MAG: hypothetical protein KF729_27325 [Sandaracinaceae bacterium]|nr:hypothetical protein [Sandaracinaceae bacterium]
MLLCVVLLVPLAGCFGSSPIACDFRAARNRCQERSGVQAANPAAYQATCEASGGSYRSGGCPPDGMVAGCDLGSEVVDWYYAPETLESVTAVCEGEGTVVRP